MTPPEVQQKQYEHIRENPEYLKPSTHETSTTIIPQNCCCHNCCCGCETKFYPNKTSPRNENQSPNKKCAKPQDNDESNSPRRNQQPNNKSKKQSNSQKSKSSGEKERPPRIKRLCMLNGGVELVPLLARRRAMQRPVNLSTTDVTKNPNANK